MKIVKLHTHSSIGTIKRKYIPSRWLTCKFINLGIGVDCSSHSGIGALNSRIAHSSYSTVHTVHEVS